MIAILTEHFHPYIGGTETRFLEIGRRLVSHGHEVHVFSVQYEKELPKEGVIDGIRIHRYAHSKNHITKDGLRSLRGVLKYSFETAMKTFGSDFDIYYFGQWPILHAVCSRPLVSPMVFEWCELWYKKVVVLEKIIKRITNHHIAVSRFTKQRLIDFLHIEPKNITVIPNGVDHHKFNGNLHDKKVGRIVYVGRIVPHKHVDMLIDAFRLVKERIPEAELHIIGSGPALPVIRKQASVIKDIHVHGQLPEKQMLDVLKSSWLFILPSEREGFGLAPLEAMATGTPVLTVDYPDNAVKDLCTDNNGLIVPPGSKHIASAIQKLFSNEEHWQGMSEKALSLAAQYDWNTATSLLEGYFQRVIENS